MSSLPHLLHSFYVMLQSTHLLAFISKMTLHYSFFSISKYHCPPFTFLPLGAFLFYHFEQDPLYVLCPHTLSQTGFCRDLSWLQQAIVEAYIDVPPLLLHRNITRKMMGTNHPLAISDFINKLSYIVHNGTPIIASNRLENWDKWCTKVLKGVNAELDHFIIEHSIIFKRNSIIERTSAG